MKLNELAVANPTKQAAKVFESYFSQGVDFDAMTPSQARGMLKRVRALIAEHRRTPAFHSSERNPAYLKLVVMEQALATAAAPVAAQANPQQTAAAMTLQRQQQQRNIDDQLKQVDQQIRDLTTQKATLQKQKMQPAMENRLQRRLREASEVQQAQVVLASQDMVDQVQKMSEQISAMQFKDLPALVDQIKNEVGTDQAMQFNTDATAALAGLLQNLQGAKTQLEAALGVVTGQAPQVPGADMGADLGAEMPAELPAPGEEEITDTEVDIEEPEAEPIAATLGRGRR
jgi:CRISPR/Cas system CSM-associated protein Csm2 small subunit